MIWQPEYYSQPPIDEGMVYLKMVNDMQQLENDLDNDNQDLEPTPYQGEYRRDIGKDDDLDADALEDPVYEATLQKQKNQSLVTDKAKTDKQAHDFKKRYDDLKRHYDTKLNEWKQEKQLFEAKLAVEAKKHNIQELPKTEEELEHFKEKYPDVYDVVETISALKASERVKGIEDHLQELRGKEQEAVVKTAEKQLIQEHPDFVNLKEDENFLNWLNEQPVSISDGIYKNNTDVKWAARVLDLYKADAGIKKTRPKVSRSNTKGLKPSSTASNSAADAVTRTNARRTIENMQDDKKVWTITEISRLKPWEYEKVEKDIDKALKEGRVIDSVE